MPKRRGRFPSEAPSLPEDEDSNLQEEMRRRAEQHAREARAMEQERRRVAELMANRARQDEIDARHLALVAEAEATPWPRPPPMREIVPWVRPPRTPAQIQALETGLPPEEPMPREQRPVPAVSTRPRTPEWRGEAGLARRFKVVGYRLPGGRRVNRDALVAVGERALIITEDRGAQLTLSETFTNASLATRADGGRVRILTAEGGDELLRLWFLPQSAWGAKFGIGENGRLLSIGTREMEDFLLEFWERADKRVRLRGEYGRKAEDPYVISDSVEKEDE